MRRDSRAGADALIHFNTAYVGHIAGTFLQRYNTASPWCMPAGAEVSGKRALITLDFRELPDYKLMRKFCEYRQEEKKDTDL
jgi:hypothetical protein